MFFAFHQCLSSMLYQVLIEDVKYRHLCFWEKRLAFCKGISPQGITPLFPFFSPFILFGGRQYFNVVFRGIYLFSCEMDCLNFAKQTDCLLVSQGAEYFSIYVQIPVFLGYTVSFHARGKKLKGSGSIKKVFAEILYSIFTFHTFFSSFWSLALWRGQVLGISWHQRQMLCWGSVLLPRWPVPGCLPAWLALLKPELLLTSLPGACSQGEKNSAFMFSMVAKLSQLDSVFPKLNDTTSLWQSVKVVRKFQHIHFCSVLGSTAASLCALGKAMWFYLFPHFTLFLCLYHVNENACPQTLRWVAGLF